MSHMQDETEAKIVAWIGENIGPVTHVERQGRWRPAWLVDVVHDGEPRKLYVRGARGGDWPPQPLKYEAAIHRIFETNGLRVPHVHGYIEDPAAIVMDLAAGRPNLTTADSETDRAAIRNQLVEQMVAMHGIDPGPVEAAGAPRAADPDEVAVSYYRAIEQLYLRNKTYPSPAIEFVRLWLNRNVPQNREGAKVVTVDAGQFLFEGDRLTALLDFEFAGLGDFHTDLAALRIRNRAEYIGDLDTFYRAYSERSGLTLDYNRIRYHTAGIGILTPLQTAKEMGEPRAEIDYHEYMTWNAFCIRIALDSIAEIKALTMESFTPPEAPRPSRYNAAQLALELSLEAAPLADDFARYKRKKHLLALRFIERADRYQPIFEARYIGDVAQLTGSSAVNWAEADRILEDFVAAAGPENDETLLRLFHRQYLQQCFLLTDPEDTMNYETLTTPMAPIANA